MQIPQHCYLFNHFFVKYRQNIPMNNFVDRTNIRPFMLYVVFHPEDSVTYSIGQSLVQYFSTDRFKEVTSGANVRVQFRRKINKVFLRPELIDWNLANTTAVVVLIGEKFVADETWVEYFHSIVSQAESRGFNSRVFPVALEESILKALKLELQALKWYEWTGNRKSRSQHLIRELIYEFSRMLRFCLELPQGAPDKKGIRANYGRSIRVFLSHSKHDDYGYKVAKDIRDWLKFHSRLSSFLDIDDIPAGVQFSNFISDNIEDSVMVVIYTDSYSSRTWCQREVIEAKQTGNPMLIVNCLEKVDERVFPYLGNVPAIRMNPELMDNIEELFALLLEEIFKYYLWNCRVHELRQMHPEVLFIVRSPELLSLAHLPAKSRESELTIVYPEPPIGTEELQLIKKVKQNMQMFSISNWTAREDSHENR